MLKLRLDFLMMFHWHPFWIFLLVWINSILLFISDLVCWSVHGRGLDLYRYIDIDSPKSLKLAIVTLDESRGQQMTSDETRWHHMTSETADDIRWHQMTTDDIKWHQMTSVDSRWHQNTSNDIRSHQMKMISDDIRATDDKRCHWNIEILGY